MRESGRAQPAKVVVYSMAYRGDVYPYVPIASALAERGHDVVFVVPREFHRQFAAEPFRCAHSGTDFGPSELDRHATYVARWGRRFGGAALLRLYYGKLTVPFMDRLFAAIDAEVADADLLISHPAAAIVGAMASERNDVPLLVGDLFPMLLLTEYARLGAFPYLGRRANRLMIAASRSRLADGPMYAKAFRTYRARLGLSTDNWNVIDARLSPTANLGLVPSAYVMAQPDWPENYRLVGFTKWKGPTDHSLSDDVQRFLAEGEPPIAVTLGTSAASAHPQLFETALDALDTLEARGVFLTSNEEIATRIRRLANGRHLVRSYLPLAPLLDHVRAIVHSGAHGTNSLALLAGVPSVVHPCLFDQLWHARRQEELGTGVWARRPGDMGPSLLAVLDPTRRYALRAREFAAVINGENGAVAAADEAEHLLLARGGA